MFICLEYYSLVISLEFRIRKKIALTVKNRYTTNTVADHISSSRINVFFCLHRVLEKGSWHSFYTLLC